MKEQRTPGEVASVYVLNRILWGPNPFAAGWMKWYLDTPSMWGIPEPRWWDAAPNLNLNAAIDAARMKYLPVVDVDKLPRFTFQR